MKNATFILLFALLALMAACTKRVHYQDEHVDDSITPREKHRPLIHFTPPAHWMNDPNGMVYLDGEYHLFYQYYPDGTVWGPMHWGYAVSTDLLHWQHLPIALYPDSLGYIFSGSAVVDWNNTSGFGKNGKPPLVAIFTYHDMAAEKAGKTETQSQGIAYSNDQGRTWAKYASNPAIPNPGGMRDFRDPKVCWHAPSKQWVMVLAVADHVEFWGSPDLKHWQRLSEFGKEWGAHGGVWECPDLFPMKVEGSDETRWVLLVSINPGAPNGGSGTQYFVGDFDGKTFTPDPSVQKNKPVWIDYGRDDYAGVTWSDIPDRDGRRLFLGWMSNWDYATLVPTVSWRSAMTLPRSLTLHRSTQGYRLFSQPAKELHTLRQGKYALQSRDINGAYELKSLQAMATGTMEVVLEFEHAEGSATTFGLELYNASGERYRIGYDAAAKQFFSDRRQSGKITFSPKFAAQIHTAPRFSSEKTVRMRIIVDVASAEMFADDGSTVLTDVFFPNSDFNKARLFAENGTVRLIAGEIYGLKSAIPPP